MKISIITPFFNGNKYINDLLKMIEENSLVLKEKGFQIDVEYIVVNDSPNITIVYNKDIIKNFHFEIINNKINSGVHKSRINGLRIAKGDHVLFLDQDDRIEKNTLLSQINNIQDADVIVSNGYIEFEDRYKPIYKNIIAHKFVKKIFMYIYIANVIISPGQCMIKKSSIPENWCKYIVMKNGSDDMFLWLLMLSDTKKITINKEKLYWHKYTSSNLSLDYNKMEESSREVCLLLRDNKLCSDTIINEYLRRLKFKSKNKNLNILNIFLASIKNIDIIIFNIVYKIISII